MGCKVCISSSEPPKPSTCATQRLGQDRPGLSVATSRKQANTEPTEHDDGELKALQGSGPRSPGIEDERAPAQGPAVVDNPVPFTRLFRQGLRWWWREGEQRVCYHHEESQQQLLQLLKSSKN